MCSPFQPFPDFLNPLSNMRRLDHLPARFMAIQTSLNGLKFLF